jgi:hypothetical protein
MKRLIMLALVVMSALLLTPFSTLAAPKEAKFLKDLKVTGALLEDGGTFKGKVTISEVGYSATEGFWVSGVVQGTATKADGTVVEDVKQSFSQVPATLNESSGLSSMGVQAQAQCQILFLDIGPIFLDLLGLQVDLSEIVLDITAVSGAGNLLGNLLCAVAGLLDPNGFLTDIINFLDDLLALLEGINNII